MPIASSDILKNLNDFCNGHLGAAVEFAELKPLCLGMRSVNGVLELLCTREGMCEP